MRTEITWTDAGLDQYKEMKRDVERIHAYYGEAAGNFVGMSLFICMERLFTCGPANVQRDANSLYVSTPHIVFGVNWHRAPDPTVKRLTGLDPNEIETSWPVIGTWSLNS